MATPESFKDQVLQKLQERGVYPYCELCKHNDWMIFEHPVSLLAPDVGGGFAVAPAQIPAAGLVCKKCGNMRLHSLGTLDLLPLLSETASA